MGVSFPPVHNSIGVVISVNTVGQFVLPELPRNFDDSLLLSCL